MSESHTDRPAGQAEPESSLSEQGQARPEAPQGGPDERQAGPNAEAPEASAEGPDSASEQTAPQPRQPRTLVVRYGSMGHLGRFRHTLDEWSCGQSVIIKSDRGQEMGVVVGACAREASLETVPKKPKGEVLRVATHGDEVEARHLHGSEEREAEFCRQRIAARNLPMKLVSVEHLFGGDRIVFYFVAESRVDFRGLVRDLAREFQTRIEMRQIGVRDEARLLGDYERCGRPLCCRTWIKDLAPVSMKMAKVQKATLDPSKISGHCGRLMCCLRFEHSTYKELARNLPRKNTYVRVREGVGKVVDSDVVTQIVGVFLPGGTRINVPVESILERDLSSEQVEQETSRRGERRPRRRSGRKSRGEGKSSGGSGGGKDRSGQKRRRRSRRRGRRKDRSSGSSRGNAAGSDRKTDSAASNRNPSNGPRGNG